MSNLSSGSWSVRLLASALLASPLPGRGGDAGLTTAPPVVLAHTEHHALTSARIGQRYELLVSLPRDYGTTAQAYPVLYVLDGWHFPFLAAIQDNNPFSGRMPPVIIVTLSYGDVPDVMARRARDFTPTADVAEPTAGGAPAFLDFLEQEVLPFIERSYRTVPGDRSLLGHSYGGLFAVYTLTERPALFRRIVAASPALEWDHRWMYARARERLRTLPGPVRLDLSAGDEQDFNRATAAFARLLDELRPAGLEHRFTLFPGENHNSVRFPAFPHGLYWVYRP